MLFKVIFILAAVSEFLFVPWFLRLMWPKKNVRSLVLKMICSGLFVVMFLCAALIRGSWSAFTILMIIGALFGFAGDYLLHTRGSMRYFLYGLISFLLGHFAYIAAFTWELLKNKDFEYGWQSILTGLLLCFIIMLGIIYGAKKNKVRLRLKAVAVAVGIYSITLIAMVVQATTLAAYCFAYQMPYRIAILCCLIVGSVCFLLSDGSLGIIQFAGKKKDHALKIFNIMTYFAAQMLLAASVMFLG